MALNKTQLRIQMKAAFEKARQQTENPNDVLDTLVDDLADAFDTYVKTATVNTTVIGTLPNGPVAASGTGNLS